jgi:ferredoxin
LKLPLWQWEWSSGPFHDSFRLGEYHAVSRMVYLKGVVTLELDESKCCGCGMCAIVCARGVFEKLDGKASVSDRDSYIECGACALNCPSEAISVRVGVGCAAAIINSMLGRTGSGGCCCSIDQYQAEDNRKARPRSGGCC